MSSIWTIRRSTSDVKLAGLCGGIARHWGVDPVLVRVAFALLALSGGVGRGPLPGRLAAAAGRRPENAPVDDLFGEAARKWPREVWIAIVVIACVAGFAAVRLRSTPFSIGPAVVIAVIWYFGFYKPRSGRDRAGGRAPAAVSPARRPALLATPARRRLHRGGRGLAAPDRRVPARPGSTTVPPVPWPWPRPGNLATVPGRRRRPRPPVRSSSGRPRSRPRSRARASARPSWPPPTRWVSTSSRRGERARAAGPTRGQRPLGPTAAAGPPCSCWG